MKSPTGGPAKSLLQPAFLIAVAVLATTAFGIGPRIFRDAGPKLPVPLKRPLSELTKDELAPYVFRTQIPLNPAVQEVLGTDQFIDWRLDDSTVTDSSNPMSVIRLSVSYYTGGRDQTPHTPDQCMVGAGYRPKVAQNLDMEIPSLGRKIPVRVLTFEKSAIMQHERPTVAYFFVCNGEFVCDRDSVRMGMNSLSHKHAYFAKIEVAFGSERSRPGVASREDSIAGTAPFLDRLLPVLLRDHLPDWDAVVRQEEADRRKNP